LTSKPIWVQFIPHDIQPYNTVGWYHEDEDFIRFQISDTGNPNYNNAILIHEFQEWSRNKQLGITDDSVDKFDLAHPENDDPGLLPDAPYHKTHMEGDALERLYIILTGEDWVEYQKRLDEMSDDYANHTR
jgi:hypothetical protein